MESDQGGGRIEETETWKFGRHYWNYQQYGRLEHWTFEQKTARKEWASHSHGIFNVFSKSEL